MGLVFPRKRPDGYAQHMEKDTLVDTDITGHDTSSADTQAATVVEELLVEEISIDGMCGVY